MCDQLQYMRAQRFWKSMVWEGRVRWKMGNRERMVEKGVGVRVGDG